MSKIYRVDVTVTEHVNEPAVKNRYGDVETPAQASSVELIAGSFSTTDEATIRDRVSSMLNAAGIVSEAS